MGDFLIDLLKKSRLRKPTDNTLKYYSVMKHGASIPITSVITQSSPNNTILPGNTAQPSQNTTTTTSTTTTTTTQVATTSTTTTTTTLPPGVYAFVMKYSTVSGDDACSKVSSTTYYSNSATLDLFFGLAIDSELTTAAPAGYYCLADGCPNAIGIRWIRVGASGGSIVQAANC